MNHAAYAGQNNIIISLKHNCPKFSATIDVINRAALMGHNDTILLLKKEFPELTPTSRAIDCAARNMHNETILLLKNSTSLEQLQKDALRFNLNIFHGITKDGKPKNKTKLYANNYCQFNTDV